MKRIKTWKRWARVYDDGTIGILCGEPYAHLKRVEFAVRQADKDRKFMTVHNAAMRWDRQIESGGVEAEEKAYYSFRKACERARK